MRRQSLVAFGIIASLLVVSGGVVAQSGLSVASIHSTFGTSGGESTPATLNNVDVIGSGSSADVVKFGQATGTTGFDTNSRTTSVRSGWGITPSVDLYELSFSLSQNTSGVTTAYITDESGNVITTTAFSGDGATFDVDLDAGTTYRVLVDADGSSYTQGYDGSDSSYPKSRQYFDIEYSYSDGQVTNERLTIYSLQVKTAAEASGSGRYISAPHDAEKIEQGRTNLTLENASANVRWEYNTGSGWNVANSATYSTSGNHTADLSGFSADSWRANISIETSSGTSTARIHDESVLFEPSSPNVTNVSPSDGETLDQQNPDLEVQVNDSDFATAQGDPVTIEWFVDGSSVNTQTVTSNGTYSYTVSGGFGAGTHDWNAEVTDDYGLTDSSSTWTFESPGTLYIYNETDPDQLIDNQGEIEVSFYGNNSVITRTTTDGTVDLSGLPANETLVVTANVDNYESRRIVIESLFEQQNIYLLNENVTAVTPTYTLDDNTGNFPPSETTLLIRLPITKDFDGDGTEETQYETVLGDQFGAVNEFSATLRPNIRYQLVVFNQDGDRRALGSHTVDDSSLVSVPIGQIRETPSAGEQIAFTAGVTTRETQSGPQRYVELTYVDPTHSTSSLQYEVVRADNESNVLIANQTESGPLGTFRLNEPIPSSEPDNASYIVRYHADRDGTNDVGGNRTIGSIGEIDDTIPVDGRVLELIGFVAIVAVAGLVGIYDDALGAVSATATGIGLTWLGIVHIPSVGLAWAGVTSVVYVIVRRY